MPRVKRAQVTTTEPPAKPATSTPAEKKNGHNGNAKATFDLETTIRARAYELYEKRARQDGYAQDGRRGAGRAPGGGESAAHSSFGFSLFHYRKGLRI